MNRSSHSRITILLGIFVTIAAALLARSSGAAGAPADLGAALKTYAPLLTINNPAAVYCQKILGYEYQIVTAEDGSQTGICVLPDAATCGDWDFLSGTCGVEFSYCATLGLQARVLPEGGQYTDSHVVCVNEKGEQVGSVEALSDLGAKSLGCGGEGISDNSGDKKHEPSPDPDFQAFIATADLDTLPASFDWRNATYNSVTGDWTSPVKNQGNCGSCWAFSAVGTAESVFDMAASNPNLNLDLSEEYLVSDCHMYNGYQNCCGGWKDNALLFIKNTGIPDEGCMPYTDGSGSGCSCGSSCGPDCTYRGAGQCSDWTCANRCGDYASRMQRITQTGLVGTSGINNDPAVIKAALMNYGPLAVSLDMSMAVKGGDGVYRCSSIEGTDHAVVIVGWDDSKSAWIVRNSWGATWNGDGHFYVGYDQCLIQYYVYYAQAGIQRTISGYVKTATNVAVAGVTMSGLPGNPVTNASGFYTASVPNHWNGTVTPQKGGWTFSPLNRTYADVTNDQTGQNYTGAYSPSEVLLVDDDDNNPDVRSYYTTVLTNLGHAYDIWDTNNSDNEPLAADLAGYKAVIWFTGGEFDGYAGPGAAGSTALASYLAANKGCLMISGQDYYYDRGLTAFMSAYLGVANATNDTQQGSVTGAGFLYNGLGPYTITNTPTYDWSDIINPNALAGVAFTGPDGNAGIYKDTATYRTLYLGFPVESLANQTDREWTISRFLLWCNAKQLTTTVSPTGSGTVGINPPTNFGLRYGYGTPITLTATANPGWAFKEWTGGLTGTANPGNFNITADTNVTAVFLPCYSLTVTPTPGAGGLVNANPAPNCAGGKYISGTIVTLTASANPAYAFVSWAGGATGAANPVTVTMNANKSVTANFTPCYSLTTATTGSGSVGISPAANCAGGLYKSGTAVTLTATADPGNYFANWSGSLTGAVNPSTVSMTANKNITANFLPCYPLNVGVTPGGAGTVTAVPAPNCAGGLYKTGTVVTLTAAVNPAFAFNQWTGDASGTTNPRTVTMDAAKNITAEYLRCWSVTKSVSPALSGSYAITPAPNCAGGLWKDSTNLTLAATPAAGNHFLQWNGDWGGTANPSGFIINSNKSITAEFVTMPALPVLLAPASNALATVYTPSFDWTDAVPNLDHYEWQVATDAAFANIIQQELNLTASNFTPSVQLPSNQTLYWRVRSVDAHGFTRGWTAARLLRTALLPPNLVAPANAAHLLYPRPTFDWENVDGATGYNIQIAKNDTFTLLVTNATVVGGANSQFTPVTNLPPNLDLFWRVRTNGLRGPSGWSEARTFHSPNPPSTPLLIAPLANALDTSRYPVFDWGPSTVPAGTTFDCYLLQVDDNADFSSPHLSICVGGIAHHYYATADPYSLTPNTVYYWRVQACNTDAECSAWSLARTLREAMDPPVLSAPADLDLVPSLRPALDWDNVAGANGYTLQLARNDTFTLLLLNVNITGGTNSQYTPLANLPANLTVYWRVRANGLNGPSLWSTPVRQFTTPNPPTIPAPLLPALNSLQTDLTPLLTWTKPLNPTTPGSAPFDHYQVQVATDAAFTAIVRDVDVSDYNTPQWEVTPDLNPNTKYYWRVRAWNTLGHYSAWSTAYSFRTALSAPSLTYPADAAVINLVRPPFDWADVTGATGYTVQVSKNNTFTLLVLSTNGVPSAYTPFVNLPTNIPLYWRVRANGLNGPSLWSPVWSFTIVP